MLIYDFTNRKGKPLYEFLYNSLKRDILNGRLAQGSKLPSKRTLAKDNKISVRTVINAYEQLIAEGFIVSEEKKGYFVAEIFEDSISEKKKNKKIRETTTKDYLIDFTAHQLVCERFPISMWKKVIREVLTDYDKELVQKADYKGVKKLRSAIADYLYRSRGMDVDEECVVIGAGLEYLYRQTYTRFFRKMRFMRWKTQAIRESEHIYDDYDLSNGNALRWMRKELRSEI